MTDIENKLLKISKEYETLEEKCNETGVKWTIYKDQIWGVEEEVIRYRKPC